MHIDTRDLVSITEFSRRPSAYVTNLKGRERKVILRNNAPIAVLMTPDELETLDAAHQDAVDLVLALARKLADEGSGKQLTRCSLNSVSTGMISTKSATRTRVSPGTRDRSGAST